MPAKSRQVIKKDRHTICRSGPCPRKAVRSQKRIGIPTCRSVPQRANEVLPDMAAFSHRIERTNEFKPTATP